MKRIFIDPAKCDGCKNCTIACMASHADMTPRRGSLDELRQDYGIQVYPIVTVREVISFLHNNPVDGKVYIDDAMKGKMEAYLAQYGAK